MSVFSYVLHKKRLHCFFLIKYLKSNNSTLANNNLSNGSLPSKELNFILIGLILSDAAAYGAYIDHLLLLIQD